MHFKANSIASGVLVALSLVQCVSGLTSKGSGAGDHGEARVRFRPRDYPLEHRQNGNSSSSAEPIRDRIERVTQDIYSIEAFYNIETSPSRLTRLTNFYNTEIEALKNAPFSSYDQDGKVDYILLRNLLQRNLRTIELAKTRNDKMAPIIPFAPAVIGLYEQRQRVDNIDPQKAAQKVHETALQIAQLTQELSNSTSSKYKELAKIEKNIAFRAANTVSDLNDNMAEWFKFYKDYDPLFTWWVAEPYGRLNKTMAALVPVIREKLVGIAPGDDDAIVGQPIGREGLLAELEAEVIPYTPEELIEIGEKEYKWCEAEMKKASRDMGFGDDWRKALEQVKNMYVPPGEQPAFVRDLVREGNDYVQKHDLVTVPPLAAEVWRMIMIPPQQQKTSPFFLGGPVIQVSYPTSTMQHDLKLQSLRANNRPMARAVGFHEMIPGHHLQLYIGDRSRPYRGILFSTPFFIEGWALYWEMQFWNRGDFFTTPADKVGTLFWRMHRCIRIVFSLRFHLGQITPQEAIDMLVERVGHERATAEGEVRRSFNGDYSPLYQAGYMLGALQLMELRREVLGSGAMREKDLHDKILKANSMPIEMLRTLIEGKELSADYSPSWKFYSNKTLSGST